MPPSDLEDDVTVNIPFEIVVKSAPAAEDHYIAGFAYVSEDVDGSQAIDISGEVTPVEELRTAMQRCLRESAVSGDMHEGEATHPIQEMLITSEDVQKALAPRIHEAVFAAVLPEIEALPAETVTKIRQAVESVERYLPVGAFVRIGVDAEAVKKVREGKRGQLSIQGWSKKQKVTV